MDGNGLYACIIVDGPASSHHGAAQETEEDAQLCFNCASTAFMCRACQPDDDDPTANLFCSDECFQKSHRLLLKTSSEQMAQHTTRDIKVMYPLCSGPMAGCEQDFADKYCMQCASLPARAAWTDADEKMRFQKYIDFLQCPKHTMRSNLGVQMRACSDPGCKFQCTRRFESDNRNPHRESG